MTAWRSSLKKTHVRHSNASTNTAGFWACLNSFLHVGVWGWHADPTVEECAEFIEREAASMDEKDGTRPDANRVMVWFTNRRCVA